MANENLWYFSPDHGQLCQVIETRTLWGKTTCRVWLPGRDSVVRVPASRLTSLEDSGAGSADGIAYVASAPRVADVLTRDLLLAPIESSVNPLPHPIKALARATAGDRVHYLPADGVGLGKTIKAGLIFRELKLRGRALMREFEEYLPGPRTARQAGRESKRKRLKVFRLEAVRAGFRKAWQERDYATIIAVARRIPEKILQEDPKLLMWYDQAVTRTGDK